MKKTYIIVVFVCVVFVNTLSSQWYINAHFNGNYWQHTEIFGPGGGLGLRYSHSNWSIDIDYDFGYNSVSKFDRHGIDIHDPERFGTILDFMNRDATLDKIDLKLHSDYAKQHQLNVAWCYSLYENDKFGVNVGAGLYIAHVSQFFTFKNKQVVIDNIFLQDSSRFDYTPILHQDLLAYGATFNMSVDINKHKKRIWSPYITLGYGSRYTSFATVGVKLFSKLRKKNKKG